jgi:hypothetical protein
MRICLTHGCPLLCHSLRWRLFFHPVVRTCMCLHGGGSDCCHGDATKIGNTITRHAFHCPTPAKPQNTTPPWQPECSSTTSTTASASRRQTRSMHPSTAAPSSGAANQCAPPDRLSRPPRRASKTAGRVYRNKSSNSRRRPSPWC